MKTTNPQAPTITVLAEDVCASAIGRLHVVSGTLKKINDALFSYKCCLGTFYFKIIGTFCLIMNYDSSRHSSFRFA